MYLDKLATTVLDAAFAVHREFGPGLLESVYELCMIDELTSNGLKAESQVPIPVIFKGRELEAGFRIDILGSLQKFFPDLGCATLRLSAFAVQIFLPQRRKGAKR